MLTDKQKAIKNQYRIPEVVLFSSAFMGGSAGCLLGMYTAHHKTRKPTFFIGIPLILFGQIVLICMYML